MAPSEVHYHVRIALLVLILAAPSCLSYGNSLAPAVVSKLQKAINSTKKSPANITAAYEACDEWNSLMETPVDLPDGIRGMCLVLQASCLVRTGQDDKAELQFDKALMLKDILSKENREEAIIGRGRALQRLMKYADARDQFLESSSGNAICAAASCAMRLADAKRAFQILKSHLELAEIETETEKTDETAAMLGTMMIILLTKGKLNLQEINDMMEKEAKRSLLYRWILYTTKKRHHGDLNSCPGNLQEDVQSFSFLDLAKINISPFDEPTFIHLDDKVLLHRLLNRDRKESSKKFWPKGVVLPTEGDKISKLETGATWILKRRSGYGSHGNQIVNPQEANNLLKSKNEEALLQQMVHPPLLLNGYKFSLRVYVVYFGTTDPSKPPEVYISTEGLVKLASVTFQDDNEEDLMKVHMTNSGRESEMTQYSFAKLKKIFEVNGWPFETFWGKVVETAQSVMTRYIQKISINDEGSSSLSLRLAEFRIPKILGFDFVVDANRDPWLVEVNRFPGLEPRGESDLSIKHKVVKDSWGVATKKLELNPSEVNTIFGNLLERDQAEHTSCLARIL